MKKIFRIKIWWITFCFLATIFLGTLTTQAQVGIYGSVPQPGMPTIRFARIYQPITTSTDIIDYSIPINGLGNFVFYYAPTSNGFLPGGNYCINYLGADRITSYGLDCVTYTPNSGFTNGVEVRPLNPGAGGPLGIQGTVLGYVNDFTGSRIEPLTNAFLLLQETGGPYEAVGTTNGNGFFSFYYTGGTEQNFVPRPTQPQGYYQLIIYAQRDNCTYTYTAFPLYYFLTNTTNPNLSSYFVTNARTVVDIPILQPFNCQ